MTNSGVADRLVKDEQAVSKTSIDAQPTRLHSEHWRGRNAAAGTALRSPELNKDFIGLLPG